MNEGLPDDLRLALEDLENPGAAKSLIMQHKSDMKSAVSEYGQRLMSIWLLFLNAEAPVL